MSRASKYLRKKLAEGGTLPKEENILQALDPQQAMLQPQMKAAAPAQAQLMQPQVKPSGSTVNLADALSQQKVSDFSNQMKEQMETLQQVRNNPTGDTQLPVTPGDPSKQTPEQAAEATAKRMGLSPEQFKSLQDAQNKAHDTMQSPEYQALLKRVQDSKGQDAEAMKQLESFQQQFASAQQQATAQPKMAAAAPAQAQQATAQPQMAAASSGISTDQRNWLANNDSEYIEMMRRDQASRGNDPEAKQRMQEIEDAYVQSQQPSEPPKTTEQETDKGFVSSLGEPVAPKGEAPTLPNKTTSPTGKGYNNEQIVRYHKERMDGGWKAYEDAKTYYDAEKEIYDKYTSTGKQIPKPQLPKKPITARPEEPQKHKVTGYKVGAVGNYYMQLEDSGWPEYDKQMAAYQVQERAYNAQQKKAGEKPVAPEEVRPTRPQPEPPKSDASDADISQYEIQMKKWRNENRAYLQYQEDYQTYLADIEAYNKGDNTVPPTDNQQNKPKTGGSSAAGETNVTSGDLTVTPEGKAPVDLQVRDKPTYTAPEVEVAKVAEDEKVYRNQFPEGEEGTRQYKVARAKEAQKLQAQGVEKPTRGQFPEGEYGDIEYEAAVQRFRQTPLAAEGTVTEAKDIQTVGEAGTVTGQAVDAQQITDVAEQAAPAAVTAPEDVAAASMEAATIGQEMPERPKAGDYDRTTEEGRQKFAADLREFDSKLERIRGYERPQPQDYKDGQNDPDFRAAIEAFRNDPLPATKAVQAAEGTVSEAAQAAEFEAQTAATVDTAQRDAEAEAAAQADAVEYDASQDAYVNKVTGKVATVEETADAEAKTREAILGQPAPDGEAAQIMSMYDFNQSQQRAIQGQKAKDKAIKQLKAQGVKDDDIAQQLADNPELIADQMEDLPSDVRTTLSGLPQEALVSVQMESLMAGMEDGEVPMWARPALAKVEANLAKRGMGKSSVGRDALFNAIIQSAIPLAQSNAAAIQQATAQDKQIAADFLAKNAGFQQQMELANLSNDQQMRLANLSAQNQAASESLSNEQQTELANLNARMQTNLLQGKIAAEMNQAQLNVDQQRAVTNASMVANIDMAKFNAAQQVELANSKFMQSMVQTQFNADQQSAMQNATMQASLDLATLGANEKLRAQNAQAFLQMDMANLSNEQQAAVLTAQQRQQALLSNQAAENAAAQFNAANEQQANQFMANLATTIQQFNVQSNSAREQFNATEANRIAAINAGNKLQADQFEAQLFADIAKFNEQQDYQRDQWNAANAQAVEQSNVQWRRQSNLADTAAQNAANQQNAQIAYNLTSQELSQVWQQLRDQAAYVRQSFENEQQRKAQLLATAISNEKFAEKSGSNAYEWYDDVVYGK